MEDLFKKFIYTGVGLVAMTAEKLQEAVEDMVDDGKLSKEEGRKVMDDLLDKTESKKEEFEERLKSFTQKIIEGFNLPTRSEINTLSERIASLEAKLESKTAAKPASSKKTSTSTAKTPAKRTVKKVTKKDTSKSDGKSTEK
jgi:polyhydroxyalkanoate synthesis regulator phasin